MVRPFHRTVQPDRNTGPCFVRWLIVIGVLLLAVPAGWAQESPAGKMAFDLPADDAERSLKRFALRSGLEVVFVSEAAANVRTNAVQGDYTPREAVDRMLAGTKLAAMPAGTNDAIRIVSASGTSGSAAPPPDSESSAKKKRPKP